MLFNTENMILLVKNCHFSFFVYQFIIVLMLSVNQSKSLTAKARIVLCRIGYDSLININNHSIDFQRKKIKGEFIARYVDSTTYNKMLSNFLCFAYAYINYAINLKTSSLCSHPLELSFGRIREGSRGKDTGDMAIHVIAKGKLRDRLLDKLGQKETAARGRCDIAGSFYSDGWDIDIPDGIDCSQIPNEVIQFYNNELSSNDFFNSNTWKLVVFLNENSPTVVPNLYGVNSGSRIFGRNCNLRSK